MESTDTTDAQRRKFRRWIKIRAKAVQMREECRDALIRELEGTPFHRPDKDEVFKKHGFDMHGLFMFPS